MDCQDVKQILLPSDSGREFIFIHGYTGGMTDFGDLPAVLHEKYDALSICMMLPGHGTKIEDLIGLSHEEILAGIEERIKNALQQGKSVVLVGLSFGAQAALYLATKYPVVGVVAISTTHALKFPFTIPGLRCLAPFKKIWKKRFTSYDLERRAHAYYYDAMPIDGLAISHALRDLVDARIRQLRAPTLFVHSLHERLGHPGALPLLKKRMVGPATIRYINNRTHSMFFSDVQQEVIEKVVRFIDTAQLFTPAAPPVKVEEKVTAIIPAYNEAPRIAAVLDAISCTPLIDEIIVVDDGSTDDLAASVEPFPKVKLIRNEKNIGKGASMDRGVECAKNDVIFFCDADLINFTPRHAEIIITPVLRGEYDMYVGLRGNFMQRAIRLWALNSGERALRKEIWQALPAYYKHRFRIEAGLNYYVQYYTTRGLAWKQLDYSQPLKELKYGAFVGTLLRWKMNFDILAAYFTYPLLYYRSTFQLRRIFFGHFP